MLLLTVFTFHTHLIRSLLKSLFLGPDGRVYVIQFTSIRNAIGRERVGRQGHMCLVIADRFIESQDAERVKLKWLFLIQPVPGQSRGQRCCDSCSGRVSSCVRYLDIRIRHSGKQPNCLISGGGAGSNFADVVQTTQRVRQEPVLGPRSAESLTPTLLRDCHVSSDGKLSTLLGIQRTKFQIKENFNIL